MHTGTASHKQLHSRFTTETFEGYNHECAILRHEGGRDDSLLAAVQIIPDCFLRPLGLREYGYSRWNSLLLHLDLAILFETNALRITEGGVIYLDQDLSHLYNVKDWTKRIVHPPRFGDDDSAEDEVMWRRFLLWRWEKYGEILRVAGDPLILWAD